MKLKIQLSCNKNLKKEKEKEGEKKKKLLAALGFRKRCHGHSPQCGGNPRVS